MAITLPADFVTEKNKLTQTAPWIWLFECHIDADNSIRAAKYTSSVTWPSGGGGDLFHAYPIRFDMVGASTDGDVLISTLTIPNVDRQLMAYMRDYNGMTDKPVIIRLSHSSHLDETDVPQYEFEIADCQISREVITWKLGAKNIYTITVPYNVFSRNTCRHQYGTERSACPIDKTAPGCRATCPRTYEACKIRGLIEANMNREQNCPRMWGGFPSMPLPVN